MVNLTCNHCGASLDVDIDNLQAYCPFCGNKLMIDVGQMSDILKEKERTKQKYLKYERDVKVMQTLTDKREEGRKTSLIAGILIFLLVFAFIFLMWRFGPQ